MSDDKELPPSEKKLRKAQEENEDPQSEEVNAVASLLVLAGVFYVFIPRLYSTVLPLLRMEPLELDRLDVMPQTILAVLVSLLHLGEIAAIGLFAAALGAGLLGNLVNRRRPPGVKMPSISYNPMQQVKQMFQPRGLIATAKLWVFAVALLGAICLFAWSRLPLAAAGVHATDESAFALCLGMLHPILPVIVLAMALSAVLDSIQKRMNFVSDNKMDHEEVKQENKEDNGDPIIKSKRRELMQEI